MQDCLSLYPQHARCSNLTWDQDSQVTPPSGLVMFKPACRANGLLPVSAVGCTDDVLVAMMIQSVPHHEFSRRRWGPHLSLADTSSLFDIMHLTWDPSSRRRKSRDFVFSSNMNFNVIQSRIAMRLPPSKHFLISYIQDLALTLATQPCYDVGTDLCLQWRLGNNLTIECIACQLEGDTSDVRHVTYIAIGFGHFSNFTKLVEHSEMVHADWDAFLCAVRRFPYLRHVVIQDIRQGYALHESECREFLVETIARLGEAWMREESRLRLYYRTWDLDQGQRAFVWVEVRLNDVVAEIRRKVWLLIY